MREQPRRAGDVALCRPKAHGRHALASDGDGQPLRLGAAAA